MLVKYKSEAQLTCKVPRTIEVSECEVIAEFNDTDNSCQAHRAFIEYRKRCSFLNYTTSV